MHQHCMKIYSLAEREINMVSRFLSQKVCKGFSAVRENLEASYYKQLKYFRQYLVKQLNNHYQTYREMKLNLIKIHKTLQISSSPNNKEKKRGNINCQNFFSPPSQGEGERRSRAPESLANRWRGRHSSDKPWPRRRRRCMTPDNSSLQMRNWGLGYT